MSTRRHALVVDGWVILATVGFSAVALWRPAADPFSLPKTTAVVFAAVALVSLAAYRVVVVGTARLPRSPAAWAALAFLVGLSAATLASDTTMLSVVGVYKRYTGLLSYVSYVVLFLGVLRAFVAGNVHLLARAFLVAGAIVTVYGTLQALGADPFMWENLYGDDVFATLGNPNFAGAYAGIVAPFGLWALFDERGVLWRALGALTLIASAVTALKSGSLQGPTTVSIALFVMLLVLGLSRGGTWARVVPRAGAAVAVVGFALVSSGLTGAGPLSRLQADETLQLRRYYWGAAAAMFADKPVIGVGLDRYAGFYRRYRSQEAATETVFTVSADNPHNVPLKMFADGGIVLGLAYLSFLGATAFVLLRGLITRGPALPVLGAFAAAWVAYQAQALVSIDVAALGAAHWLIAGGVVVAAGQPEPLVLRLPWAGPPRGRRKRAVVPAARTRAAYAVAALIAGAGAWFSTLQLRADMAFGESRAQAAAKEPAAAASSLEKAIRIASWEPTYWFQRGALALGNGGTQEALRMFNEALEREPRGLEQLVSGARAAAQMNDMTVAEKLYLQALDVEPYAPEMKIEVADFYITIGRPSRALEFALEAVNARGSGRGWVTVAQAYELNGERTQAEVALRNALSLEPGYEPALKALAQLTAVDTES